MLPQVTGLHQVSQDPTTGVTVFGWDVTPDADAYAISVDGTKLASVTSPTASVTVAAGAHTLGVAPVANPTAPTTLAFTVPGGGGGGGHKIVLIPYENHNLAAVEAGAPNLMKFAAAGALATNFTCSINGTPIHPSLPNYMQRSGGANPFPGQDCDTCSASTKSLWDLVEAAGLAIEVFCEGLASTNPAYDYNAVFPSSAAKLYDNHHVWPVHYKLVMGNAARKAKIKDLSAFSPSALPDYCEVVPNVAHEMHSGSVAAGDAWAQANFPPIIAAADLTICWFDEGKGPLYVAFYGRLAKPGVRSNVAYGNNDLLATLEHLLGLGSLGTGDKSGKVMSDMLIAGA